MHRCLLGLAAFGVCGAFLLSLAACAPSNEEACKAAAETFQKCGKTAEDKWGDKQRDLCKQSLDAIADKDKSEAKDHAKSLKKCAKLDDCDTAQTCMMILLVDDMRQARELRCAKGEADDCLELAARYLRGEGGVSKDEPKAAAMFQKACDGGSSTGCEFYAKMLRDGRGVAKDEAKAMTLLGKACDGGAGGACTSVGLGAMKSGDTQTAVAKFIKACEAKDGLGCASLGAMYLHGNGVDKDLEKAKPLLKKACDLKVEVACDKLKEIGG
jgi:TPR repeat protein